MTDITVIGDHDQQTIDQLVRCVEAEEGAIGALCADGHFGYSQPVGGAVAYRDHVSVSGVGYDIGCGNKAVQTDLRYADIADDVPHFMDEIVRRISFGVGRPASEPSLDHPVLDEIRASEFKPQRAMLDLAAKQLGTVGAGNHYVDLFRDDEDRVWVGVHFGSRGFGHKTANGFLALAQGLRFTDHGKDGEMTSPPVLLALDSDLGQSYLEAMTLAGAYAYAGRDVVVDKVCEILGAEQRYEVHNHHNFAWPEFIGEEEFFVVRKGCTPAYPGQAGFVGATMGGTSVILEGVMSDDSHRLLYSTVHGAGRAMSRTRAAGKSRKRWRCNTRDCDWVQPPRTPKPDACPECGSSNLRKRWVKESEGEIDWAATTAELHSRGIELRGGAADEAPGAYKDLTEVLSYHLETIHIKNELHPIGVAMAGADTHDPFRD